MKVLVVCSYRSYAPEGIAPFVKEQMDNISMQIGEDVHYFVLKQKGIWGYLKEFVALRKILTLQKPDIIHAHYGLCGLLACMASGFNRSKYIPVVTTYHGSDINEKKVYRFSKYAVRYSDWNIFVSNNLKIIAGNPSQSSVVPCGVDIDIFQPRNRKACRDYFHWEANRKYILFSKAFSVPVKNYPLAKAAVDKLENAELVELKGYTREEVSLLMNACDCALMTSFTEGSPQFIKEALSCGCPVVSTDVGDVKEVIEGLDGCYITSYDVNNVVDCLRNSISFSRDAQVLSRRNKILSLFSNKKNAERITEIYSNLLK